MNQNCIDNEIVTERAQPSTPFLLPCSLCTIDPQGDNLSERCAQVPPERAKTGTGDLEVVVDRTAGASGFISRH